MKKLLSILPALALTLISVGCSSQEDVATVAKDSAPSAALFAGSGIIRPDVQCGSSEFADLITLSSSTPVGTLEMANDAENIYLFFTMSEDYVMADLEVFYGNLGNLPLNEDATLIQYEAFDNRLSDASNSALYTYTLPLDKVTSCNALVIRTTVQHLDFTGSTWGAEKVVVDGASILDGTYVTLCADACPATFGGAVSSAE